MGERLQPPVMFPCASGVKMPHVGADESAVKKSRVQLPAFNLNNNMTLEQARNGRAFHDDVVRGVTTNLSFTEDVVKERCFYMLQYDNKYLSEALDVSDIIPASPKKKILMGRHNKRGSDKRHMPCHIKSNETTRKLKPMKKKMTNKAMQMHREALTASATSSRTQTPDNQTDEPAECESPVFITEEVEAHTDVKDKEQKVTTEWDEYLMSLLSKNTAQWIVNHQIPPNEPKQAKLQDMLQTYHGATRESTELLPDTVSESEFPLHEEEPKHTQYKKSGETLLDRVRKIELSTGKQTDPYGNDNEAAFYRLPAGFRRAKKYLDKEEAGAINQTAYKIEIKPYVAKPLPTLKDWINPEVGNKVYSTDNLYEQEWLTGGKQVYQTTGEGGEIVMSSRNRYQKILQEESPKKPEKWYVGDEEQPATCRQLDKGLHRWQKLPQLIDDTAQPQNVLAPGGNQELMKSPDPMSCKQVHNNTVLTMIVDDWRSKWHLDMRYADATPDDLIRDMADLHPNIRLKAITTCARAAEYRPPKQAGIVLSGSQNTSQIKLLPEKLYVALQCCLDDQHEKVRVAAAIALYTLERPCPQADSILRTTLKQEKSVDRWTAAQCLAYYGECDSAVVGELVAQLLNSEDKIRHEQAAYLLGSLSENSTLVHCMLGEQLNSSCWRHRVMVCRTFPKLYGHINKDLVNKLTQLMWHDWHQEVRKAAAQCLGKTGHGKKVHDELLQKMLCPTERVRVEAISKVGHLGFMTAKLLPVFLKCFDDNYVSVRSETCLACSNLIIQDDQIVNKLVHLATYDPIWKVKALAIQALGNIGRVNKNVRGCILWALRYEDQEGIRAEACHTAMILGFKDTEMVEMLQDRLLTENSPTVRKEITQALELMGISPSDDMHMVARIKNEVRKLGTCENIAAQITANEKEDDKAANINRMIAQPKQKKKHQEQPKSRPVSHVSSQRGSHALDSSRLTPVADQEIITILHGKDTPSTLSDHLTDHAASRQKSAKTVTTEATDDMLSQLDDDEYDPETRTISQLQPSPQGLQPDIPQKERTLTEKHLYIEISSDQSKQTSVLFEKTTEAKTDQPVYNSQKSESDIVDVLDFGSSFQVSPQKVTPKIEIIKPDEKNTQESGETREITQENVTHADENDNNVNNISEKTEVEDITQKQTCRETSKGMQLDDNSCDVGETNQSLTLSNSNLMQDEILQLAGDNDESIVEDESNSLAGNNYESVLPPEDSDVPLTTSGEPEVNLPSEDNDEPGVPPEDSDVPLTTSGEPEVNLPSEDNDEPGVPSEDSNKPVAPLVNNEEKVIELPPADIDKSVSSSGETIT